MFRGLLSNRDIQWVKLTKTYSIFFFNVFGNFSGVRKWRNSISGSDETKIFIYKVPFTLHSLVELIHNSTNAKEQKNRTSQFLQKRASKLVLSLPEHKKVEDFFLLPIYFYNINIFFKTLPSAVQCSAVQCSAVQSIAVQSSTLQCTANQKFAIQWSSMQSSELNCCELKLHIFFF